MLRVRAVTAVGVIMFFLCSCAIAQDASSRVQIFVGYSFLHGDNGGLTGAQLDEALRAPSGTFGTASSFNGWNAEVQYSLRRWFAVAADVDGHYGTPISASSGITGLPSSSQYSLLLGPVLSYKTNSHMTPFVHMLFGFNRENLGAGSISGLPATAISSFASVTDTNFAMALGGGIDYRLSPRAAFRVGQLDYLYTAHDLGTIYGDAFGTGLFQGLATHENNLRFSTGIVLKF